MATDRLAPDEYDLNARREDRLERSFEKEPRVSLRKVTDVSAERAEALRLNFASAFTKTVGE